MNYSFLRGLWKAVITVVLFGLPVVVTSLESMPQTSAYLDLTVGGVLSLLVNYIKVKTK